MRSIEEATVERPHRGILVADGLLGSSQLDALLDVVAEIELEAQQVGVARVDGLPERRQRGETTDERVPTILWAAMAGVLPPLSDWFEPDDAPLVEPGVEAWVPTGCNPRTRLYRYSLGERFAPHVDEPWRPSRTKRSFLTVLAYLPVAGGCVGGETVVRDTVVAAEPGRILVMDHRLRHESRPVESGAKLVMRSDIVYEATP